MAASADKDAPDIVGSLSKGLKVLEILASAPDGMRLTEVANAANLTRAGARRLMLTFVAEGWVLQEGRQFLLSAKLLTVVRNWLGKTPLWRHAVPILRAVSQSVGESCSVSVPQGEDIVYVARVVGSSILAESLDIGARLPAHCTSMGRVLLSELDDAELARFLRQITIRARTPRTVTDPDRLAACVAEVRRNGYAIVDEELELGLRSIAVPVRARSGRIVAAVNVSTQTGRHSCEEMRRLFLPHLRWAAERIEEYLPLY